MFVYTYVYLCVYIYIHIHTYIYTYTYTYLPIRLSIRGDLGTVISLRRTSVPRPSPEARSSGLFHICCPCHKPH